MTSDEKRIEALSKKAEAFKRTFLTQTGQEVMEALDAAFNGVDLRGKSVEDTYYNLGARDVLMYINQLIEYNPRLKKQTED